MTNGEKFVGFLAIVILGSLFIISDISKKTKKEE